ncbi:MAG: PAS domain S-box protein [Desulfobacterales bacterium]|nr:PAS domain S-box protein [Desulfobacterales bacterium]
MTKEKADANRGEGELGDPRRRREKAAREHPADPDELSAEDARRLLHELQVHQIELKEQNEELRRTQLELAESRDKYAELYDFAPVGYFSVDENGRIMEANLTGANLLGVDRSFLIDKPFSRFVVGNDQDAFYLFRRKVFKTGARRTFELEMAKEDGESFAAWLECTPVRNGRGDFSRFRVVVVDVSQRKRAEEARRAMSELNESIVNSLPVGIAVYNSAGDCIVANDAAGNMVGASKDRVLQQNYHRIESWKESGLYTVALSAARENKTKHHKIDVTTTFGKERVIDCRLTPIRVGGAPHLLIMADDVTERRRSEEALKKSEEQFKEVVASISDQIYVTEITPEGEFINRYLSPNFKKLTGYPRERFLDDCGFWSSTLIHPDDRCTAEAQVEQLSKGRGGEAEYRIIRSDEKVIWARDSARVKYKDGSMVVYGVLSDINESKRLETQFRHAQKMEAIGRLAGGVAHDFNNILTHIMGSGELIQFRLEKGDPSYEEARLIIEAAERAAELTRQLLTFSRGEVQEVKVLNLNTRILGVEKMLRRLIGEDIELITVLDQALGHVRADAGQIEQVLLNLAVNARDAMPRGGALSIETANVDLDEADVGRRGDAPPGAYAALIVTDTGEGMDEATRAHVFEPFFTTKSREKGTGLGLSTIYGIIKRSKGAIRIDSEPGRGARFEIYLPLANETAKPAPRERSPAQFPGGGETILLVEDEETVLSMVRRALSRSGYRVLAASDGEEAFRICRARHPGVIDMLATDVVMPGAWNGFELAERLVLLYPGIKVLYMSGYTDGTAANPGRRLPGSVFLPKPFSSRMLIRKVRDMLDDSPRG